MNSRFLLALGALLITSAAAQAPPRPVPPMAPGTLSPEREPSPPVLANWPGVEYTEVRAYLYNPGEARPNLILKEGKLHPDVANPEGIKLDAAQVAQLLQAIRYHEPYDFGSGCFMPHHGIVFYDREGKPVADLSICFLCQIVSEVPSGGSNLDWDLKALAKLIQELGLPVFETFEESQAHFFRLAKQWPDTKVKESLDRYLFADPNDKSLDDYSLLVLLESLGERTHPYLLSYLADKDRRAEWLKSDPADPLSESRFHRLCNVFGESPPAAAIPHLAPFLDEADVSTRCTAFATIAKSGAPAIVPYVRKAFADPGERVALCAFAGLKVALERGGLHPEAKAQLFADVKGLQDDYIKDNDWAKVLAGLDSNKATEFFLSAEIFRADSPRLNDILHGLCEVNQQLPRDRLLALAADLKKAGLDFDRSRIMEAALLMLGRQHHPDDLELLSGQDNKALASCGMPGFLAWHGLEGYRERLAKLEKEKGFAALNEAQRLHFAADEFESTPTGIYYYLSGSEGEHWRDALAGLKAMKRHKLAAILEEAVAKFGEAGPAGDAAARREWLESLRESKAFDELDKRLGETRDHWSPALDRYAIEHAESFK